MTQPDFHDALGRQWREPVNSFPFTRTQIWTDDGNEHGLVRTRRQIVWFWITFPYQMVLGVIRYFRSEFGAKLKLRPKPGMVVLTALITPVAGGTSAVPDREPPEARLAVETLKRAGVDLVVAFSRSRIAILDPQGVIDGYPRILWQNPQGTEVGIESGTTNQLVIRWPNAKVPTTLALHLEEHAYRTASAILAQRDARS